MDDMFKTMCINQGYVPSTCTMDGQYCWLLVKSQGDPCKGCNQDRGKCKGRNKNLDKIISENSTGRFERALCPICSNEVGINDTECSECHTQIN